MSVVGLNCVVKTSKGPEGSVSGPVHFLLYGSYTPPFVDSNHIQSFEVSYDLKERCKDALKRVGTVPRCLGNRRIPIVYRELEAFVFLFTSTVLIG